MIKEALSLTSAMMFGAGGTMGGGAAVVPEKFYDYNYTGFGTRATSHIEEITYDKYQITDVHLHLMFPEFQSAYGSNACAPTAASMVVTYHDVKHKNLLPDYEPGFEYEGTYKFRQTETVNDMMKELYELMGTNSIEPGTSVSQFKTGMNKYYKEHGYNLQALKFATPFSIDTAKHYLGMQEPIVLFLNSYDYYPAFGVSIGDTKMRMVGYKKTAYHVAVAWGYQEFQFFKGDEVFRTDKYLIVSFGDGTSGYLNINDLSGIDEAYVFLVG